VLNGGAFLYRIRSGEREHSIGDLSRRVAIDQLRVAVSRPAERLYWLDVDPSGAALAASRELLSEWSFEQASPVAPEAALKTLEEETLSIEERIRLCEADARQFLAVKPDIAYSRALQAVLLIGRNAPVHGGVDAALRRSAHLTFAEISFCLAFRRVSLSPQLGNPSLYLEAVNHARAGGQNPLAEIIIAVANASVAGGQSDSGLLNALRPLRESKDAIEAWLRIELRPQAALWVEQLEKTALTSLAAKAAAETITRLCELFELPQAAERARRARGQAAKALLDHGRAREALELVADAPDCDPILRARAIELDGRGAEAAEAFLAAGSLKDALRCYRSIPDFQKALELTRKMENSPVTGTLEWLDRMRRLAEERPSDFNKVILPSEKKYLEGILETALGATRRKPAVKKAAAPRKKAAPGATAKRAPRKS
jgi:hypothetical protein